MANSNITKKALASSLKELVRDRSIEKITVADISEHCGVNRQTFYYHFDNKYELVNWVVENDLFEPFIKDLTADNFGEKFIEVLTNTKKLQKFLYNICKGVGMPHDEYLRNRLVEIIEIVIDTLDSAEQLTNKEKEFYARFYSYGILGIIYEWICNGLEESVDEIAYSFRGMFFKTKDLATELIILNENK